MVMGEPYEEVHLWLDANYNEFEKSEPYRHWIERHNLEAISQKYSDPQEYSAAIFHIICDWLYHFRVVNFPTTSVDVENNLIQIGVITNETKHLNQTGTA